MAKIPSQVLARNGDMINIGDIIESVQGTKFEVISLLGNPAIADKDGFIFELAPYMSPNIWIIGEVEQPQIL